jgi:hypothetical protein
MIDEHEAYEAWLLMIQEVNISNWFTSTTTINTTDLHLIEQVSRLMMGTTTTTTHN